MWLVKNFVFSLFSIIIAVLTLLTKPVNFKGKAANSLLKIWCNGTLFLYGVKVNVFGGESARGGVSSQTGRIYISNHLSYLDIFVLLAKVPDNIRMIYKREINRIPLISWAMLAAEFVPIDRRNVRSALGSLDRAARKIRKGLSFVIFPEGTRSPDGSVREFKRGMFLITEKVEADVVPVSISNTNNLLPRGSMRVKKGIVNLVIGNPLKPKKDREFLNEIRDIIISNLKPV
jgi:1-acyl-sn-glycerol-3-phosphate acyltransferase